MVRLILNILLFIILAVFIAHNAQHMTTVDLFGYQIESVSIAAVVTIAMAVGIIYSFALYISNYLVKQRAHRAKELKAKNKEKAEELADRAKELERTPKTETPGTDPARGAGQHTRTRRSLFGRKNRKTKPRSRDGNETTQEDDGDAQ